MDGRPCKGRFDLEALHKFKAKGEVAIPGQKCCQKQSIDKLLLGFEPPKPDRYEQVFEELRLLRTRLENRLSDASEERRRYASQAAWLLRQTIARSTETRDCPRIFTPLPEDLTNFNLANIGMAGYRLTLWCEMPDKQHPTCPIGSDGEGEYTFKRAKDWLMKVAPYARFMARMLRTIVPVAGAAIRTTFDESLLKNVGPTLDLMEKVTHELMTGDFEAPRQPEDPEDLVRLVTKAEGAGLRELCALLCDLDQNRRWGGLRRAMAESGEFLWLCPTHYQEFDVGHAKTPAGAS